MKASKTIEFEHNKARNNTVGNLVIGEMACFVRCVVILANIKVVDRVTKARNVRLPDQTH